MRKGALSGWRTALLATALCVATLLALAPPASAQVRPDRPASRQELEERLRQRLAVIIKERLGLSDAEARELGRTLDAFQEERQVLARRQRALRLRLEALLVEGSGGDPDDAEARRLLDELAELRTAEAALFRREQDALLEVLEPVQVLQLHAIRQQFARRIQALQGRRDGRRPPGND